jgi:hypothetical protein
MDWQIFVVGEGFGVKGELFFFFLLVCSTVTRSELDDERQQCSPVNVSRSRAGKFLPQYSDASHGLLDIQQRLIEVTQLPSQVRLNTAQD